MSKPNTIELNFDDERGVFTVYPSDANGGAYVPLADYEALEAERDALMEACKNLTANLPESVIDEMRPTWGHTQSNCVQLAVAKARTAIAKAEGQ